MKKLFKGLLAILLVLSIFFTVIEKPVSATELEPAPHDLPIIVEH